MHALRLASALIIATALTALTAAAADARPLLTQARADRAAQSYLDDEVTATYEGDPISYELDLDGDGVAYPIGYELDPCDLDRRGAECDFTETFSDGNACDGTITVKLSRRGRVVIGASLDICDYDDADES